MVRKVSASQYKSMVRRAQQKRKQAINKLNQEIRRVNQKNKAAVSKHNRDVRAHNSRIRANRQRLKTELRRLSRQTSSTQYIVYRASVNTLHDSYTILERDADSQGLDARYNRILDLSERETANSLEVANRILGDDYEGEIPAEALDDSDLLDGLRRISPDLDNRWTGAVFALNSRNPDAARHFCTSAREILNTILETQAPDADVFALLPDCEKTDRGNPSRRSKIKFFLHRKGMVGDALEDFVDNDMENIVQLFHVFNKGTHGAAGKFDLPQLNAIKKRVEDGIKFLIEIIQ